MPRDVCAGPFVGGAKLYQGRQNLEQDARKAFRPGGLARRPVTTHETSPWPAPGRAGVCGRYLGETRSSRGRTTFSVLPSTRSAQPERISPNSKNHPDRPPWPSQLLPATFSPARPPRARTVTGEITAGRALHPLERARAAGRAAGRRGRPLAPLAAAAFYRDSARFSRFRGPEARP